MKWFVIDIYTTFTFPILKGSRRNRRMKKFLRSQNTFTEAKTANLFYTQSNSVANDKKTWHQKLSSLSLWPWPLSHSHKSYNNVYRILSTLQNRATTFPMFTISIFTWIFFWSFFGLKFSENSEIIMYNITYLAI